MYNILHFVSKSDVGCKVAASFLFWNEKVFFVVQRFLNEL